VIPNLRFFSTRSGQRVAYVDRGAAEALVLPPWWVSHLERDYEYPPFRDFMDGLAAHFRVIHYDRVGVGLSDRGRIDHSPALELEVLEQLVQHVGVPRIHLLGCSCAGPIAMAFAARRPELVGRMVLVGSFCEGARLAPVESQRALVGLVRSSWGLGSRTMADLFHPSGDAAYRGHFAELQRDCAGAETAAQLLELTYRFDATPFIDQIRAPTLVIHRRADNAVRKEHARDLASRIAGATLLLVDGDAHLPWDGPAQAILDAAIGFLRADADAASLPADDAAEPRRAGELWTVRFAGKQVSLRHAKGLTDLARLLARPQQEMHVFELVGVESAALANAGPAIPRSDHKALASYRRRLADLDEELREAVDHNDEGRRRRLAEDRQALLQHVASETGLGGRPRAFADPVERARKAVSARLRDTIERIEAALPALGEHLRTSVVTGVRCVYRPTRELRWIVSPDPRYRRREPDSGASYIGGRHASAPARHPPRRRWLQWARAGRRAPLGDRGRARHHRRGGPPQHRRSARPDV
jgi:pimeloyl-ACP methyl ester carboxylesterase